MGVKTGFSLLIGWGIRHLSLSSSPIAQRPRVAEERTEMLSYRTHTSAEELG